MTLEKADIKAEIEFLSYKGLGRACIHKKNVSLHTTTHPYMSGPFIKCQYYLSQDVIHLVQNPKVHYCFHKRPSTGPE